MRREGARGSARSRSTIRFRLGLAVAIALSPILALGLAQAVIGYTHDADARRVALVAAADRSAATARARVQAVVAVLRVLASEPDPAEGCGAAFNALARGAPGLGRVARIDASGRIVCVATSADPSTVPPALGEGVWLQRLRRGDPLVVETGSDARGPGRPAVLAAVRTPAAGRFQGALVAALSTSALEPEPDPDLPAGAVAALTDQSGHITPASATAAFPPLPPDWAAEASSPRALMFTGRDAHGQMRVEVAAPLVGRELYVLISAPAPGFLTWARVNAIYNVVLPLLGWLGAWAAVWIVTDRVVIRWLAYLDRIAAIYAKGRFSVRPVKAETAPSEIRALAQTLDAMADAIVARDLSLRESLTHKDTLMREIHHRVKNNLQIITSLLNMQQRALKDPAAREAMSDTRQRITALALIYRALYQSPDLRRVDVRQFLEELIGQLAAGEAGRPQGVRTELAADDLEIDPDKLAPLALFAVEAIAEARKHVFAEGEGMIRVNFRAAAEEVRLEISDDGAHTGSVEGVGRTLMTAFARQLRGRVEREAREGGREVVRLVFPPPEPPRDYPPPPFQLTASRPGPP